jgi:arylsulfatase A-like enzyme
MADTSAKPSGIDGQDFVPVLRGQAAPHENLFWSFEKSRAVRSGDWKLIVNPPQFPGEEVPDHVWLSNLEADPGERKNLAASEPERVRRMTELLRAWQKDVHLNLE